MKPVPIYVRPSTIIGATIACSAVVVSLGVAAFEVVSRATWHALHDNPKYGHRPKENAHAR